MLPPASVLSAVGGSLDVVFFLTGLMLLAELARSEGLFDTLSAWAVRRAGGSGPRLFALVYGIGVVVTAFMSNDATAVVLTPAVHAAARRAGARPLPYLFACALVANAETQCVFVPRHDGAALVELDDLGLDHVAPGQGHRRCRR